MPPDPRGSPQLEAPLHQAHFAQPRRLTRVAGAHKSFNPNSNTTPASMPVAVSTEARPRVLDARQALLPTGAEQDLTLTHDTFARKAALDR